MNFIGWCKNNSTILQYMRERPKEFFPYKLQINFAISQLEMKANAAYVDGLIRYSVPVNKVLQNAENSNEDVAAYGVKGRFLVVVATVAGLAQLVGFGHGRCAGITCRQVRSRLRAMMHHLLRS